MASIKLKFRPSSVKAMMSRALRRAVSPLVIGAATTPSRASTPPATPSQLEQTIFTTVGASKF